MASQPSQMSQGQNPSAGLSSPDGNISTSTIQPTPSSPNTSLLDTPETSSPATPQHQPRRANSASEPKKCWICQCDATEDTDDSSPWRSPCPCSLRAHESCLLEWFDSAQAPKPGQLAPQSKMECPVCKAEIHIDRPQHLLVNMAERISRMARLVAIPAGAGVLGGIVYSGLMIYGFNTMHMVFGYRAAKKLMVASKGSRRLLSRKGFLVCSGVMKSFLPSFPGPGLLNARLLFGLPLIAPVLVASRTRLGDYVCAAMPIMYFFWPYDFPKTFMCDIARPTPGNVFFTILPSLRYLYSTFYRHIFSPFEKEWDLAVQRHPREGETAEQIAGNNNGDGPFGLDLEVQIVGDIIEEEDAEVIGAQDLNPDQAGPQAGRAAEAPQEQAENVPPNEAQIRLAPDQRDIPDDNEDNQGQAEAQPDANGAPDAEAGAQDINRWEIRQDISTASVASTIIGALFFPTISSLMGSLLYEVLPQTMTRYKTPPSASGPVSSGIIGSVVGYIAPGLKRGVDEAVQKARTQKTMGDKWGGWFLREKWGRTVVGGCLFVVLKDAVVLYCKWRRARDWGRRKVRDFVAGEQAGEEMAG